MVNRVLDEISDEQRAPVEGRPFVEPVKIGLPVDSEATEVRDFMRAEFEQSTQGQPATLSPENDIRPDVMEKAAKEIRAFLTAIINPALTTLKDTMSRYAAHVNNLLERGEYITEDFQKEYNYAGQYGIQAVTSLLEEARDMNFNIFYKGLIRMLCHRLNNVACEAIGYGSLALIHAAEGRYNGGEFPDHYARLRLFEITEAELALSEHDPYQLADESVDRFEIQLAGKDRPDITLQRNWPKRGILKERLSINIHQPIIDESLLEFMGNALRAMPNGGVITISVIKVDDHVVISVQDTGTGISPEVLPHIFDDGFTTRPEMGGTGQGLHLVKTYVENIGGKISVESTVGEGSTFFIKLPLIEISTDAAA